MLFFETSAKSGEGVNMMIYSSITKLSFFDSYKDENKENMVKELIKINSSNSGKVYDVNNIIFSLFVPSPQNKRIFSFGGAQLVDFFKI